MTRELAVAVVGLGFGANHARVLHDLPGVRLAAVADSDPARLKAATAGRDAVPYSEVSAMLREERLDAVVVAVPAALHVSVALEAIEAGCGVLVEKPMAPSYEEGLQLVEAAQRRGLPLMAGHIERFNPALRELARRVHAGEIGRVLQITARRMGAIRYPPRDVNVIHDSAVHDIDAMRFVLGKEVRHVYAVTQAGLLTSVEDSVNAILHFEAGPNIPAPVATLEVNWLSPRRVRDLAVLGEQGLFVLRYAAQTLELYQTPPRSGPVQGWQLAPAPEDGVAVSIPVQPREQLVQELEAFADALRAGSPMPVTAEDGLAALAIADALTLSGQTGKSVRVQGTGA